MSTSVMSFKSARRTKGNANKYQHMYRVSQSHTCGRVLQRKECATARMRNFVCVCVVLCVFVCVCRGAREGEMTDPVCAYGSARACACVWVCMVY